MKTLDELISAGTTWDTVVNEAMNLIEQEERRQAVSVISDFDLVNLLSDCLWS